MGLLLVKVETYKNCTIYKYKNTWFKFRFPYGRIPQESFNNINDAKKGIDKEEDKLKGRIKL